MKQLLKLAMLCFLFFTHSQTYGQASLTDLFTVAPISLFDNTTEGISLEEMNDLVNKGESATWQISYKSEQKITITCKYPFSEISLFLLHHNDGGAVLISYTVNEQVSTVETWKKNDHNILEKIDLVPITFANDFFFEQNQFDEISKYDGNVYYFVAIESMTIKAGLNIWNEKVFENTEVDYDISFTWNGTTFDVVKTNLTTNNSKSYPENGQRIKNSEMKTKNLINKIPETQKNNSYSVIIDIIRKGSYKKYSYQMINNHFEAISFSLNKPPKTIVSKNLSTAEGEKFAQYIYSFPLETLEDTYYNKGIKGSYHLEYTITIGDKNKGIYVYFYQQSDLVELFKRLSGFVPTDERFNYFND